MRLLFVGDSLIEYGAWSSLLPEHQVLNYGCAGETTCELLSRSPAILRSCGSADAVVIMCGTNDLLMEDFTFITSYGRLLAFYQQHLPAAPKFATSLPPFRVPWLAASTIPRINDLLQGVCRDLGASYLDLYSHFIASQNSPSSSLFTDDGVHLSAAGYRIWAVALTSSLVDIHS